MNKKNINCILFNGLGGAGQRHLRIFRKLLPKVRFVCSRKIGKTPLLNSNFTINKSTNLSKEYNIEFFNNIEDAYKTKPDISVIATPSSNHFNDCMIALNNNSNVFVEKPGPISKVEIIKLRKNLLMKNKHFFISFQRRFHPLVLKFKKLIDNKSIGKINLIRVQTSSFVPFWHPYEDFSNLYAVNKNLGGGVINTEIHEIDLLNWIFGKPKKIFSIISKRSDYKINVEDQAEILIDYNKFAAQISLSFMKKIQKRHIIVEGSKGEIKLDFISENLIITNNQLKHKKYFLPCDNESLFYLQNKFYLNNINKIKNIYIDSALENANFIEKVKHLD